MYSRTPDDTIFEVYPRKMVQFVLVDVPIFSSGKSSNLHLIFLLNIFIIEVYLKWSIYFYSILANHSVNFVDCSSKIGRLKTSGHIRFQYFVIFNTVVQIVAFNFRLSGLKLGSSLGFWWLHYRVHWGLNKILIFAHLWEMGSIFLKLKINKKRITL